jgi:hypothetical protein
VDVGREVGWEERLAELLSGAAVTLAGVAGVGLEERSVSGKLTWDKRLASDVVKTGSDAATMDAG